MPGRRHLFISSPLYSLRAHSSLIAFFVCFFLLFLLVIGCPAQVLIAENTIVLEFRISYSHDEWHFFSWIKVVVVVVVVVVALRTDR